MTPGVAVRHIPDRSDLWNTNGAGGLQGEAYYRHKHDNSRHPPNHRTKTHVQLSNVCLES